MIIDNESIIVFSGSICQDFIEKKLDFEVAQTIVPVDQKANCFIQLPSVIQCINPSVSDGTGKLKFSVIYKPMPAFKLKNATVSFSGEISCSYEIRKKTEILDAGECTMSAFRISPAEDSMQLNLEFIKQSIQEQTSVDTEKLFHEKEEKLSELQRKIENEKISDIEIQISEAEQQLETARKYNDELQQKFFEISDLNNMKSVLEKNLENADEDLRKVQQLKNDLICFQDILAFYKENEGYVTVSEKIEYVKRQIDDIESHIAEFIKQRSAAINGISDELNI